MRIAILLWSFPVTSQTFILEQITSLIDLGHTVDIFAIVPPPADAPVQPHVSAYNLMKRVTYLNPRPIGKWDRVAHVFPTLYRCFREAPMPAVAALNPLGSWKE